MTHKWPKINKTKVFTSRSIIKGFFEKEMQLSHHEIQLSCNFGQRRIMFANCMQTNEKLTDEINSQFYM